MTWMDVLRGVAVLAVVLFHSGTLLRYADLDLPAGVQTVNRAMAPFRIPLLVLLSGTLLPRSMAKGTATYLVGKARAIAWPFLLWSGVIGVLLWEKYGLTSVKWLVPNVLVGGTYLWYLLFLLVFYVAALALRGVPRLPVAALVLVVAEVMPDDTKYLERVTFLFALFLLGWWLGEHPRGLSRALGSLWTLPVALVLAVGSYLGTDMSGYGPRAVVGTLAGVFVLAWLASRAPGVRVLRPLRFAGRNSVVFYVVHFPLVVVLMTAAGRVGVDHAVVLLGVAFGVAVLVGTALALARERSAVVDGLFVAPGWVGRLLLRARRVRVPAGVTRR